METKKQILKDKISKFLDKLKFKKFKKEPLPGPKSPPQPLPRLTPSSTSSTGETRPNPEIGKTPMQPEDQLQKATKSSSSPQRITLKGKVKALLNKKGKQGVSAVDTIKEIPGTLKKLGKASIPKIIKKGVSWVGGQIKKDNESRGFGGRQMEEKFISEQKERELLKKKLKEKYKAPKQAPRQNYKIPPAETVDSTKVGP